MIEFISFIDFTNMSDEEKYKLLNSKDYEIERLNNIINEFESWLIDKKYKEGTYCTDCNQVLNKLQKLKGEDKE